VSAFNPPVLLAWWPLGAGAPPAELETHKLDAAPFLAFSNAMAEAGKYTRRGRTVRIFVPETDALTLPAGDHDLSGVVLVPLAPSPRSAP
jgi:hypothetical protein